MDRQQQKEESSSFCLSQKILLFVVVCPSSLKFTRLRHKVPRVLVYSVILSSFVIYRWVQFLSPFPLCQSHQHSLLFLKGKSTGSTFYSLFKTTLSLCKSWEVSVGNEGECTAKAEVKQKSPVSKRSLKRCVMIKSRLNFHSQYLVGEKKSVQFI